VSDKKDDPNRVGVLVSFPPKERAPGPLYTSCCHCEKRVGENGRHLIEGEWPDDHNYRGQSFCDDSCLYYYIEQRLRVG
jgi:hypothetical protein